MIFILWSNKLDRKPASEETINSSDDFSDCHDRANFRNNFRRDCGPADRNVAHKAIEPSAG